MIRLRAWVERLRSSLFFVPVTLVAAAVVAAIVSLAVDARIRIGGSPLPDLLTSTVDSARVLLSVIASATIAFAGVSISISLLLIQLASSQFSPRVLYSFFRDPVTKWVTGIVIGTFTYCLMVLRVVRASGETDAPPVVPHLSVVLATVLGVGSIVAVVALINHSARSMQVGQIIRRITDEGREQIAALGERPESALDDPGTTQLDGSQGEGYTIASEAEGWLQLLDVHRLLEALPEGTTAHLQVFIGGFVADGSPLCRLRPAPAADQEERVIRGVRQAIHLGGTRTTQQDVAFVFRQLVDIALRALSPGINDPTTAEECLVHIGSLLRDLLRRGIAREPVRDDRGRELRRPNDPGPDDYVKLAFDQIRRAAAPHPAVAMTILEVIGSAITYLEMAGTSEGVDALRRQARLVVDGVEHAGVLRADVDHLHEAARSRHLI